MVRSRSTKALIGVLIDVQHFQSSTVPFNASPSFPRPRLQVLLPALRAHVRFLHLHRIAAIVLLRMLQEATVARDIAYHGGVVIMLGMLREHVGEQETVAATVHILYLITHADVMRGGVEEEVGRRAATLLCVVERVVGESGGGIT